MKNTKWWMGLWVVLSLAIGFPGLSAHGATATVGSVTWSYTVSGGKATVTGATPTKGKLTIPSELGGYPVTCIGSLAFDTCTELTEVIIPNSVLDIKERAFQYCAMTSLTLGNSVTNIADYAFDWCEKLKKLVIPDSVKHIGDFAFHDAFALASLTLGKNLESIGKYAFTSCESLPSLTIPDNVKSIDERSFERCYKLTDVTFGNGLTKIPPLLFSNCHALTNVIIGTGVAIIGNSAFFSCDQLKTLTIPDNVTDMGSGVFEHASRLSTLYVPASWEGTSMLENAEIPSGCTVKYVAYQLSLGASNRTFSAAAASGKELKVSANMPWRAKSNVSWLTLKTGNGTGDESIVYNVAANMGTASRTGKITVTGGGLTQTFTVTQNGKTVTLELGASERSFTADAASGKLLTVTADVSWTAKSSASWLTVKMASGTGSGNIEYAVAANTGAARTGTITVSGGGLTRTFTVSQSGKTVTLILDASEMGFSADAANGKVLGVTADVPWTAESSASWLMVKTGSGTGNGEIVYDVAENTGTALRTGTITVSGGGQTRMFTVTQSGKSETQESPVGVPCQWLEENAAAILAKNGGNYEATAMDEAANGRAVWECYVAGMGTTEKGAEFKVKSISLEDGQVKVEWDPDLNVERTYTLEGKRSMEDKWGVKNAESRFFRVRVEMPTK